jgi:hypothetical protein
VLEELLMKWLSFAVVLALSGFLVTGGSGCKKGETKSAEGEGGKKLTLTAPPPVKVKQGEGTDIMVKIDREKFNDPVEISFSDLPKGVTVEGGTIAKDVKEGKFTLKAAADTKVVDGEEAKVTAKGGGLEQSAKFKVTVEKKKE